MIVYAADGYCRSEGVVAVYIQKKESAKRIYATVVHSKTNCDGYKEEGNSCCLLVHFVTCVVCMNCATLNERKKRTCSHIEL